MTSNVRSLAPIDLRGPLIFGKNLSAFPLNPLNGQMELVNGALWVYAEIDGNNVATLDGTGVLSATQVPNVPWAKVTATPTTLGGFGITDAAPLASPALSGVPTAPTAAVNTNTTQIATTAFVVAQIAANGGAGGTF
jgi:hypothetical protein